jgi:hypothetical protein
VFESQVRKIYAEKRKPLNLFAPDERLLTWRITMAKELPSKIKVRIKFDVDRILYDKIVAQAKKENLKGTIENVLTQNCINWFKQWEGIFAAEEAAKGTTTKNRLVGLDGKPLASSGLN